jgi:hypothetical protein
MHSPIRLFAQVIVSLAKRAPFRTAPAWVPFGPSASPYHVKFVRYDIGGRPGRIHFRLEENRTDYYYRFNASNPAQVTRANGILSALMTAKTTGEGVYVFVTDEENSVNAVQLGSH